MTTAGTVEFKDLPTGDIRLWSSREAVEVPLVVDGKPLEGDGVPVSITIEPLTHRDAEVRNQYKNAVTVDGLRRRIAAGVGSAEQAKFAIASKEMHASIKGLEKESDDYVEITAEFMAKHGGINDKLRIAQAEDPAEFDSSPDGKLLRNTQYCVEKYCNSINFSNGDKVLIKEGDSENLSPEFLSWAIGKIEKESYLSSEDELGLQ